MRQAQHVLTVATRGKGLFEITREVAAWTSAQNMEAGLLTLFCRHTSASLIIQENADPDVRTDLLGYFEDIAPESAPASLQGERPARTTNRPTRHYVHGTEGPDDMPAHIRTALTGVQLSIPVAQGRLMLGTWQGIYLFEHRAHPHRREVVLHLLGD